MPIGHNCEYPSFDDCVRRNRNKRNPRAYCGAIKRDTEEKCRRRGGSLMGSKWIGTIALEGVPTGDGRMIDRMALYWDSDPISLIWDRAEGDHTGAVVGEVTRIWRDGDTIMAEGTLHDDSSDRETRAAAGRVAELITPGENGEASAVGVSIKLDSEEAEIRVPKESIEEVEDAEEGDVIVASTAVVELDAETDGRPDDVDEETWAEIQALREGLDADENDEAAEEVDDDGRVTIIKFKRDDHLYVVTSARIRHLAVVDTAAFAEAKISLVASGGDLTSSWRWDESLIAAVSAYDHDAFHDPQFGATDRDDDRLVYQAPERPGERAAWGAPLTITDDGRIFGHAALWSRCHAGFSDRCVRPPRGEGSYSRFMCGSAVPGVRTGPLTIGTTHARLQLSPTEAMDHYADTGRAVADVTVGEDRHGIWVAGRVRLGVADTDVAALRGSALSGDWRPVGGRLELSGILAVNNPGFLVERGEALAASLITVGPCGCGSLTAQGGTFTGAVIAAFPTEADAQRLAQDGLEAPEDLHVTLAFMGSADELDETARSDILDELSAIAEGQDAFTAKAFGHAVFNPDTNEAASVLLVQAQELLQLRSAVVDFDRSDHPVFFPHLTIGYNAEDKVDMEALIGDITFDKLEVAFADEVHVFELALDTEDDADMSLNRKEFTSLTDRVELLELLIGENMQREVTRSGTETRDRVAAQAT